MSSIQTYFFRFGLAGVNVPVTMGQNAVVKGCAQGNATGGSTSYGQNGCNLVVIERDSDVIITRNFRSLKDNDPYDDATMTYVGHCYIQNQNGSVIPVAVVEIL